MDQFITIGGTAGVDPATGRLAGSDVRSQTGQIFDSFEVMLEAVGSDLEHVVHVNIFLKQMSDFEAMNAAYVEKMGDRRPARTVIGVSELPKPGVGHTYQLFGSRGPRPGSTLQDASGQDDHRHPEFARNSLCWADDLDIHPDVGPSSVRGNDPARFKNDCGRDDERIRKTKTSPVAGAQLGGSPGDLSGGGLNMRRKGLEEVVDGIAARCALP